MDNKKSVFNNLKTFTENVTDGIAERKFQENFKSIIYFDELVKICIDYRKKYSQIIGFVVSVKKNFDPRNENDEWLVVQGFIDKNNKVVTLDGKTALSRVFHTKSIDMKMIKILGGKETRIIKLNEKMEEQL